MTNEHGFGWNLATFSTFMASAVPSLSLLMFLVPSARANPLGRRFARFVAAVALIAFGCSVAAAVTWFAGGATRVANGVVFLDALSLTMLLLVSFLGVIVTRYTCNYLAGDPGQGRFAKWLAVTLGSVFALLLSANLLVFTLAWVATSLSLHQLLMFYRERPAARVAAQKKFLISRLGDACLIAALALTWQCFGTWDFAKMFAAAEPMRASGSNACLGWTSVLLVCGALLKSAQFPFHSWLPDTMEAPTPVSALMHAGIINAGGFLVLRLSPIIASSPAALNALAMAGAFTALFASVVMLAQTNIKRALAYSTIAQMGFMMLECGLGAFALAALHIIAHSLYKAHAFLSSGSVVQPHKAWSAGKYAAPGMIIGVTIVCAAMITWLMARAFGVHPGDHLGVLLLGLIFVMGVASFLWNFWTASCNATTLAAGTLIISAAAASYFALHAGFERLLAGTVPQYAPSRSIAEYVVTSVIALLFLAVLVLQSRLATWSSSRLGRTLYVHASQGFYLGTIANQLVRKLSSQFAH